MSEDGEGQIGKKKEKVSFPDTTRVTEQGWAHSRHLINIYWINEQITMI